MTILGADGPQGQVVTPEIQAKLDLMRIQDENASLRARAQIKQELGTAAIGLLIVAGLSFGVVALARRVGR